MIIMYFVIRDIKILSIRLVLLYIANHVSFSSSWEVGYYSTSTNDRNSLNPLTLMSYFTMETILEFI